MGRLQFSFDTAVKKWGRTNVLTVPKSCQDQINHSCGRETFDHGAEGTLEVFEEGPDVCLLFSFPKSRVPRRHR